MCKKSSIGGTARRTSDTGVAVVRAVGGVQARGRRGKKNKGLTAAEGERGGQRARTTPGHAKCPAAAPSLHPTMSSCPVAALLSKASKRRMTRTVVQLWWSEKGRWTKTSSAVLCGM